MTPEEELIYLENHRAYISSRIQKLRDKIRNDKRPKIGTRLSYSGLYVQTNCLVPYIQDNWLNQDRTVASLEEKAGVSNIYNILNGKNQWSREETAEAILVALGLPHIFNEIEKVRIKRKFTEAPKSPETQFYEE